MKNINKAEKITESRICKVYKKLRQRNEKAFIPFITCGYPDMESYFKLVGALEKNGADIIEIGIPFSDPLADGPIIQATSKIALENGTNTDIVLNSVATIREESNVPIVILTYFNTVYRYGVERFLSRAAEAGIDGLIIPDLPLEEFYNCKPLFDENCIDNVMLASLTSSKQRLSKIAGMGSGFVYCVSVKGVTGVRNKIGSEVKDFLIRLREITDMPLALGFGLSSKQQVNDIKKYCDGIIMGSKILSLLLEADSFENGLREVESFVMGINKVLKSS
jgi:tryptophan synthase alpha chain